MLRGWAMNKYQESFTRICKAAAYGIGSGDNDVMNPVGYSEEMNQHFKDVETLKEALALLSRQNERRPIGVSYRPSRCSSFFPKTSPIPI